MHGNTRLTQKTLTVTPDQRKRGEGHVEDVEVELREGRPDLREARDYGE